MGDTPKNKNKNKIKDYEKKISYENKNGWLQTSTKDIDDIFKQGEDYKKFIQKNKTEREVVKTLLKFAEKHKYRDFSTVSKIEPDINYFYSFRDKVVAFISVPKTIKKSQDVLFHVIGSHIDSPRLDLKPNPLKEDASLLSCKTHYYGGIKKYQWVNIPLALHGLVMTDKGPVNITIGEDNEDPVFLLPDLLPHLAREQMKKDGSKIIEGEDMGVLIGHIPSDYDVKSKIKFNILSAIEKKYKICEKDFITSELCFVPQNNPKDVGFDRGLIGGYAHDDRSCSFASFQAFKNKKSNNKIVISIWFDKEEVGSMGDTGAQAPIIEYIYTKILKSLPLQIETVEAFMKTDMLSADVTAGINPNFKSVHDENNASLLGHGVTIEKYGGSGGKYHTNDASAEYIKHITNIMDKNKIKWQTGELGKIDSGGGGTIGMFFSNRGARVIDIGPPVIGMHSPYEVLSKYDLYQTILGYKAFLNI